MARRRTLPQNIRKYKQQYLRLLAYEARLNHQLFKMKKRIKLLAHEEETLVSEKAYLSEWLQQLHDQQTDLESQSASKQRNTQLKRVEKEYKQVKARHSRNQYQLDKLEVKKDKDNAVKLLLKEAKLEDVRIRIQSAYETWMMLEQMQQHQLAQEQSILTEVAEEQTYTQEATLADKLPVPCNPSALSGERIWQKIEPSLTSIRMTEPSAVSISDQGCDKTFKDCHWEVFG
jgi:myosin heavy subunit